MQSIRPNGNSLRPPVQAVEKEEDGPLEGGGDVASEGQCISGLYRPLTRSPPRRFSGREGNGAGGQGAGRCVGMAKERGAERDGGEGSGGG
jgi:hypothetical protein